MEAQVCLLPTANLTQIHNRLTTLKGLGLAEHIREAYAFLAHNYARGDNIYLIGFSRGAFTARSLGGLIGQIGLLNKKGLEHFYEIFQDWEHAGDPAYKGSSFFENFKHDVVRGIDIFEAPGDEPSRLVAYLREYRTKLRIVSIGASGKPPCANNDSSVLRTKRRIITTPTRKYVFKQSLAGTLLVLWAFQSVLFFRDGSTLGLSIENSI